MFKKLNLNFKMDQKNFIVYFCFYLSGISALIYEIAWPNRIQLMMGYTIYAITTILCAYLVGIALGSLFADRLQKNPVSPFWWYVIAELFVGLYGIFFREWCDLIENIYSWPLSMLNLNITELSIIQFIFCSIIIIFPTFLMGTTLPLLAKYLYQQSNNQLPIKLPTLYGVNALGGLTGILLAGFFLMPTLGHHRTIMTAVWLNFALVAIAIIFFTGEKFPSLKEWKVGFKAIFTSTKKQDKENEKNAISNYKLNKKSSLSYLWLLLVSGMVSLMVQILWNRLTAMVFGPSVYVFALVTATILSGIVLASFILQRFSSNISFNKKFLIFLPALAGICFWIGTNLFTKCPYWVFYWHQIWKVDHSTYMLLSLATMLLVLLPASTLIGMLFPLTISVFTWDHPRAHSTLAKGYSLNIFGLVAGAILASFIIMPLSGIEFITKTIFYLLIATSIMLAWIHYNPKNEKINQLVRDDQSDQIVQSEHKKLTSHPFTITIAILIITLPILAIFESFNWYILTAGLFYNRRTVKDEKQLKEDGLLNVSNYGNWPINFILDKKDDPYATISIHEYIEDKNTRLFKINGKVDGNSTGDEHTCKLVGMLPMLFKPDAKNILIIGLGTGISFQKTLDYPLLTKSTLVELSPSMINFSKKYFNHLNKDVWDNPKTQIINRDGREYLKHSKENYDLILSEPSNPWLDGVSSLFTQEFFKLAFNRLNEDGMLLNWFHGYGLDCITVISVLKAMSSVFPSVLVFKKDGDYYLLAQKKADGLNLKSFDRQQTQLPLNIKKELINSLLSESVSNESDINSYSTMENVINQLLIADNSMIERYVNLPANNDDNQYLQYHSAVTFFQNISCDLTTQMNASELKRKYLSNLHD
ncbi:MAG: hypothetical protein HQK51_13055 [Oligoflexia bacterium]|nr:hypothetical protein [Oligoflexia bacterium]